jgi:hypothetical protein
MRLFVVALLWLVAMAAIGTPVHASEPEAAGPSAGGVAGPRWSFGGPLPRAPSFDDALVGRAMRTSISAMWCIKSSRTK